MNFKKRFLKCILASADVVIMYSSLLYVLFKRLGDFSFSPGSEVLIYLSYFFFIHIFWLAYLFLLDFYEIPPLKDIYESLSNLAVFYFVALSTASIIFYFQIKVMVTPKTVLLLDVAGVSILVFFWRVLFKFLLTIAHYSEKAFVIGSNVEFEEIMRRVARENRYEVMFYKPAGRLDIPFLKETISKNGFDFIVLAFDIYKEKNHVKDIFSNLDVGLNYVEYASFYEKLLKKVPIDSIDEIWFLENLRKKGKVYEFIKRIFDIVLSSLGLIVTAPLFILVALVIKISSPGPVFYEQKRVGKGGRDFIIYKFRTMRAEPEEKDPDAAFRNEYRIAPLGRLLRATHLDELPQFYNILRGDISFVGPRPEWFEFVRVYRQKISFYEIRSLIKPGLTGWAQIMHHNGATVDDVKEKLKYDLYYMKHSSLALDLTILLRTCTMILTRDIKKIASYASSGMRYKAAGRAEGVDVLIADDEKIIRDSLERLLKREGYNTLFASNAAEALEIISGNSVKVALLDIRMPGAIDGLGALQQIRRDRWPVEVILMTGFPDEKTRLVSKELGAFDFLEKPFESELIRARVREALKNREFTV